MGRVAASGRMKIRDFGTSLIFTGVMGAVDRANTASIDASNFTNGITVGAWVKVIDTGSSHMIMAKDNGTSLREWQFSVRSDRTVRFIIFVNGGAKTVVSTDKIEFGKWYFIGARYDKTNIECFINGSMSGSTAQTANIDDDNSDLRVGALIGGNERSTAKIDEVSIYNTPLSNDQINDWYYGIQPPTTDLQLYWKFDEGSGTEAIDSSPNANTGTNSDAVYSTDVFMKPRVAVSNRRLINPPSLTDYIKSLSGLVAYYPLDEESGDAINQAPDTFGTLNGTVEGAMRGVAGQVGNAYSFDGVNDQINIGSVFQPTFPYSMFALFKTTDITNTRQPIISNGDGKATSKGQAISLSGNSTTDGSMYLLDHQVAWRNLNFKIQDNDWHIIVCAISSTSCTTYLDGVNKGTINFVALSTPIISTYIGGETSPAGSTFKGSLQHAGIINGLISESEALTMAELAELA